MNCKKYIAPAIEIITMQTEGMIAGSPKNGSSGPTIGLGGFTIGSGEGSMGGAQQTSFEVEEPTSFELNN